MFSFLISLLLFIPFISANIDYAVECEKGYRVSAIRRSKTAYTKLGALTVECEQISKPEETTCSNRPTIPKCSGALEGCTGESWLAGFHAFLLENSTQAIVLDPVCCSSPSVHLDTTSCIHDQLNMATKDFSHSVVSDLVYRGIECWHQYNTNRTLVDLLWKTEICPFQSDLFPLQQQNRDCEECSCVCGISQCANGAEPVRVIHKRKTSQCSCDCRCTYLCVDYN